MALALVVENDPLTQQMLSDLLPALGHVLVAGSGRECLRPAVHGPDGPVALGDERGVRQVMANLLGNAVKYADPGRALRVDVTLEVRGSRLVVTIADNGRGIEDHEREAVFERFARAGSVGGVTGSGIGLSLCRLVVERHGGAITCHRGPGGIGTASTFDLPRSS